MNVGLDFGFLNNRITGSFEYFHKVVSDLLAFRKLNSLMEVSTIADNIGATQSTGYEFSLNTVNLTGPFKWNTTLNISSYNDRWKERNPDVVLAPYEKEDAPIRAIYGCVSDGILQIGETPPASMPDLLPGQMKVKDLSGIEYFFGVGDCRNRPIQVEQIVHPERPYYSQFGNVSIFYVVAHRSVLYTCD